MFNLSLRRSETTVATLGRVAPPFVASRHFPRFIGDIYPAIMDGAANIGGHTPIFGYTLPLKRERWRA